MRAGRFARERIRESDTGSAAGEILSMDSRSDLHLQRELDGNRAWDGDDAVLIPLPGANHELRPPEVHVLDAHRERLHQPKPACVEKAHHPALRPLEPSEEPRHLFSRQHDGQAPRSLGANELAEPGQIEAQHVPIQKEQRRQGQVLRGRRHASLHREVGEERGDLHGPDLGGVPALAEADEAADPSDVRLLRPRAEATRSGDRANGSDLPRHAAPKMG